MNATVAPAMSTQSDTKEDILIVDDTIANIQFLSSLLVEQGYLVRKALNGPMALQSIHADPPSLILLDINMPGMNGYEVCRVLKENEQLKKIPIIFLSALDSAQDKVQAFQMGGADYITKPFQLEEVIARIENQLALKRAQESLLAQNLTLQRVLEELRQTHLRLLQQEKMASIGQLAAGMAHEINNPLSFIAGNLSPAREYLATLFELLDQYQAACPNPPESVQRILKEIDLEFIARDFKSLVDAMQNGVDRIQSIILALRIFSRLGEAEIKSVNLHDGLDSTLLLLNQPLADLKIRVIKTYGDLPPVKCHAGQVNQVFLNILNNAIEALSSAVQKQQLQEDPTIWICTERTSPTTIQVRIRDNGVGISPEVQRQLFDPFFTTKPIGQGVGLNLASSYQIIVNHHHGQLTVESAKGAGAEFCIELPIALRAEAV